MAKEPKPETEVIENRNTITGIINIQKCYNALKDFLEKEKHYHLVIEEREDTTTEKENSLKVRIKADRLYDPDFSLRLRFELKIAGKPIKDKEVDGKAHLHINAYIIKQYTAEKHNKSELRKFFDKLFYQHIAKQKTGRKAEEIRGDSVRDDVENMIKIFRQQTKSSLK